MPEAEEIREQRTWLQNVWSRTHTHWERTIDPWIWGKPVIWPAGSDRSSSIPSTARSIIENASDTQLVWEPRYHRQPVGDPRSDQRQLEVDADDVEAALRALTFDTMLKDPQLAFKGAGKFMGGYGYSIIAGPIMGFEDRPEKPTQERGESDEEFKWREIDYENTLRSWNPIQIWAPLPKTVLLDPSEREPSFAIINERRYVGKLKKMLTALHDRERKPDFIMTKADIESKIAGGAWGQVEVVEYWDKKEHHLLLNDMPLFSEKNLPGFVPYNHAFAGFGMQKTGDDSNDPFYKAQGLLEPVLASLKTQAQASSARQNALIERSYPRIITGGDAGELAEQLAEGDGIIEGNPREIAFLQYPELERGMTTISGEADKDIQIGTFASDVAGIRQQGVSTVGQQAILTTNGSRKFATTNKQLNMMATIVGMNTLKLVDRYGEPITAGGKTLDPKQIHHDYSIVAEFLNVDLIVQLQRREVGMREVQMGLKSHETYRETDAGIPDETLEKTRLEQERVRQGPAYLAAMDRKIAEADGMAEAVKSVEANEAGEGGGGPLSQPQISDTAGGGAERSMRKALTPDTQNPPRSNLPGPLLG